MEEVIQEENEENTSETPASPLWPKPLQEIAFHGITGEFVKCIDPHTEADPIATLVNFLTSFGSIVGSRPYFQILTDKQPMRLFVLLVGDTAEGRKGSSWSIIRNIYAEIDPVWKANIQSGLASGEGLIWAVRDPITRTEPIREKKLVTGYQEIITDQGIQDKRLLVVESEFASTLKVISRDGNTLSGTIRDAWDTGDLQTLTKNTQAKTTNSHIAIIGHITPSELLRLLTEVETKNGFGNRFLFICVKRSKELPFPGNLEETQLAPIMIKLRKSVEFAKNVYKITWAEETKPLWKEIYSCLIKKSREKSEIIKVMTTRAAPYIIRLACIYTLLDCSTEILPVHLQAACAIWEYNEDSLKYIFHKSTGNVVADTILAAFKKQHEGMSRTQINALLQGHKTSGQIIEALQLLATQNLAFSNIKSTGGRSEEIWHAVEGRNK